MAGHLPTKKYALLKEYGELVDDIGKILEHGRMRAYAAINSILTRTYWEIGKRIAEYEQKYSQNAGYGGGLFERIAKDMRERHGKGFSRSNVIYMRLLFLKYPKSQTLSDQLSWSHYTELLSIEEDLARSFYEQQCIKERWSVRELRRQVSSALFHRIALSKDKNKVLELSKKGLELQAAEDAVKDPYVLEFLKMPEGATYTEKELERRIIENLQMFLLELGKGFTFVARQKRITIGNEHYYADLIFYHRILKCFVIIDLKIGHASHMDIGQMNMYLNYFRKEENAETDNEPIGIILAADKKDVYIEYALGGLTNKLFVSKYRLYLPDKEQLESELRRLLE